MIVYGVTANAMVKAVTFAAASPVATPLTARWAFDLVPGATHWKQRTRSWVFGAPAIVRRRSTTPLVVFGSGNHRVYMLNAVDGQALWTVDVPGGVSSQAVSMPIQGQEHPIVVTERGTVLCLDILTGKQLWARSLGQGVGASVSPTLVPRAHLVVVGTTGGRLVGLRVEDGTEAFREDVPGCEFKSRVSASFAPAPQLLRLAFGCKQGDVGVVVVEGILDVAGKDVGDDGPTAAVVASLTEAAVPAVTPISGAGGDGAGAVAGGPLHEELRLQADKMSLSHPLVVAGLAAIAVGGATYYLRRHASRAHEACSKRL
jgi:hypothetical protein